MTKKQLLWLFLLLLLLFILYKWCCKEPTNGDKPPISPIVCHQVAAKNAPKGTFTQCYRQEEYVITFPNNSDSVTMRKYLEKRGLKRISTCPCSKLLQLWGGVPGVGLVPDGQEPPPPPALPSGGNIVKNFFIMEIDTLRKTEQRVQPDSNIFKQPPLKSAISRVKIAIVDSGIDTTGEFQTPSKFLLRTPGYPFICGSTIFKEGIYGFNVLNRLASASDLEPQDNDGHGTFINGIITTNAFPPTSYTGSKDYVGDSENVYLELLHARFAKDRHSGATLFDALCGVHYALEKDVKVINASWRALSNETNTDSLRKVFLPTLQAIKDKNAILVAAAGNDHLSNPTSSSDARVFPASFSRDPVYGNHVIAVGAWDLVGNKVAIFSNQGTFVDIYAPGVDITSTDLNRRQSLGSGTSYATPYVSRLVAITLGQGVPADKIKGVIINNAKNLPYVPPYSSVPLKMLNHNNSTAAAAGGIF